MQKIYLLSGNGSYKAWWDDCLPYFKEKKPIPLELPGFGSNTSQQYQNLEQLAQALLDQTEENQEIFAVGINALVVLHALVRKPNHFSKVILLAPVGAFLWERNFVKIMSWKPIRKTIHFLLKNFPKVFAHKFSSKKWTASQYKRMGEGYKQCKAFEKYFEFVQPHNALTLFEWIETPIELIWGTKDAVLGVNQAPAWDSILPRADLSISIHEHWEHYPYIDNPEEFAHFLENHQPQFKAHTKGGRLSLATLAGLPVPKKVSVTHQTDLRAVVNLLNTTKLFAIRSSASNEDKIDQSNAGIHTSYLRVAISDVISKTQDLFTKGIDEVVIQEFVEPVISGVAFARNISAEIDLVEGHLEEFISGKKEPYSFTISKMGESWEMPIPSEAQNLLKNKGFKISELWHFLQKTIKAFHYQPSDIEWAWDGYAFYLLQIRPVTHYLWRRSLTSANMDEILPKQVSVLMEHTQRRAALSIGRIYSLWDKRVLNDNEPFSVTAEDNASYINSDLFLTRFKDWGLPSKLYAQEIGGAVPHLPFNFWKFCKNIPVFLKMQSVSRKKILEIEQELQAFETELESIRKTANPQKETDLANWFTRYYVWIVQRNIFINNCISTSFGSFWGKRKTVYDSLNPQDFPHRIHFESDPATPRNNKEEKPLLPFPVWSKGIKIAHLLNLAGLQSYYFEVREWFRDNNMRLFHRLHNALEGSEWLKAHEGIRTKSGCFWQNGGETLSQAFSFVIYLGHVEGILGKDILVVDALEPGHFEDYKQAKAVISRTGGRLSHGATLLRELQKPSAVISNFPKDFEEKFVIFENGKILEKGV